MEQAKVDPSTLNEDSHTPLFLVRSGSVFQVLTGYREGFSTTMEFDLSFVCCMQAVDRGHDQCALYLLEQDVPVDGKDNHGVSPLERCVLMGNFEVAAKLVGKGAWRELAFRVQEFSGYKRGSD